MTLTRRGLMGLFPISLLAQGGFKPRPATEIRFTSQKGEQIRLSQYKGKVVAVEFLLTTCPSCMEAAKLLSRLQTELGPRGFQAIGLAIDPGAGARLPDFVKNHAVVFPVGVYPDPEARKFMQVSLMNRLLMPQLMFVDRKGMIRDHKGADDAAFFSNEEKNVRALVNRLLAEKA
jgi:peroxiredoxin